MSAKNTITTLRRFLNIKDLEEFVREFTGDKDTPIFEQYLQLQDDKVFEHYVSERFKLDELDDGYSDALRHQLEKAHKIFIDSWNDYVRDQSILHKRLFQDNEKIWNRIFEMLSLASNAINECISSLTSYIAFLNNRINEYSNLIEKETKNLTEETDLFTNAINNELSNLDFSNALGPVKSHEFLAEVTSSMAEKIKTEVGNFLTLHELYNITDSVVNTALANKNLIESEKREIHGSFKNTIDKFYRQKGCHHLDKINNSIRNINDYKEARENLQVEVNKASELLNEMLDSRPNKSTDIYSAGKLLKNTLDQANSFSVSIKEAHQNMKSVSKGKDVFAQLDQMRAFGVVEPSSRRK